MQNRHAGHPRSTTSREIPHFADFVRNDVSFVVKARLKLAWRTASEDRLYFLKMDLGIRQWTPLRMSTTWETRQSPTMEVSE
jgi:hypothetical protein